MKSEDGFTCIIPFYNESENLLFLLIQLQKIKSILEIICVDDGSTNGLTQKIRHNFPHVILLRTEFNEGKVSAIRTGLLRSHYDNIFLLDGDIYHFKPEEFMRGIDFFLDLKLPMLVFRIYTTQAYWDGLLNKYVIFSGTRLLKKDFLERIIDRCEGYQLEAALNDYFMKQKSTLFWIDTSAINPNKLTKHGFRQGLMENIRMELSIIRFAGLIRHLGQLSYSKWKKLK